MHARSILAITAMAFGLQAGLAQAQPQERRDREQRQEQSRQEPQRQQAPSRDAKQQPARQSGSQRAADPRQAAAKPAPRQADRAARAQGPGQRYHQGQRLAADHRGRQYVVDDWRSHRLSAPPRGHHWVQVGADYVLVAIATGIITQIILNH